MFKSQTQTQRGMTLVEVLITAAIIAVIFTALYTAILYSMRLMTDSRVRMSAMSLANERMEYLRSLSYDDVGTVSGFPAGAIPQNRTITLNGITFTERVLIDYIDDPADGEAGADSNGIITDYKKVKVEISWVVRGETKKVSYVSNIVPVSVETNAGGGAINVEVNDADGSPLPNAEVRVTNDTLAPAIDVTRYTGPNGLASFIVPAGSNYHASTTKTGYSVDKTYRPTAGNPNPSPGSFTVLESLITDQGFQIGKLSDIQLTTLSAAVNGSSTNTFVDASDLQATSSVVLNAGQLELENNSGVYQTNGTAKLKQIKPGTLDHWQVAVIVGTVPVDADYRVHFYTGTTTGYTLVDEDDLPGNTAGFTGRIVDLSALDVSLYPDLTVELDLTGNTTNTPQIDDVAVYYRKSSTARSGVDITLQSQKTIGSSPNVYKYDASHSTDGNGQLLLTDMEFDSAYTLFNTNNLTLTGSCADVTLDLDKVDVAFTQQAGVNSNLELRYENTAADTALVTVETDTGELLPGAVVTLQRTGFSKTAVTDACGQVFFGTTDGAATDYTVSVSRVGYANTVYDPYEINGQGRLKIILNAL